MKVFNDILNEDNAIISQPFGILRKSARVTNSKKVGYAVNSDNIYSVHATVDINIGEIIEICPVFIFDEGIKMITKLNDMIFAFPKDIKEKTYALALGYGSLYRYSDLPNAKYHLNYDKQELRIIANETIISGDEITLDFGDDYINYRENKNEGNDMKTFNDVINESHSSRNLRIAMEAVHDIQFKIQTLEKEMLKTKDEFLSFPVGDIKREPFKNNLIKLNKEKSELVKLKELAEMKLSRALSNEDIEDIELNLL